MNTTATTTTTKHLTTTSPLKWTTTKSNLLTREWTTTPNHQSEHSRGHLLPSTRHTSLSSSSCDVEILPAVQSNFSSCLSELSEHYSHQEEQERLEFSEQLLSPRSGNLYSSQSNESIALCGATSERQCLNCFTKSTPLWRRFGQEDVLCNACGLYQRVNGAHRPVPANNSSSSNKSLLLQSANNQDRIIAQQSQCSTAGSVSGLRVRSGLECVNCGTSQTSMWRRNPAGEPVCNACGLYFRLNGINRPVEMRREAIRTRKRRTKPMLMLHAMLGPNFFESSKAKNSHQSETETVIRRNRQDAMNFSSNSLEKLLNHQPEILCRKIIGASNSAVSETAIISSEKPTSISPTSRRSQNFNSSSKSLSISGSVSTASCSRNIVSSTIQSAMELPRAKSTTPGRPATTSTACEHQHLTPHLEASRKQFSNQYSDICSVASISQSRLSELHNVCTASFEESRTCTLNTQHQQTIEQKKRNCRYSQSSIEQIDSDRNDALRIATENSFNNNHTNDGVNSVLKQSIVLFDEQFVSYSHQQHHQHQQQQQQVTALPETMVRNNICHHHLQHPHYSQRSTEHVQHHPQLSETSTGTFHLRANFSAFNNSETVGDAIMDTDAIIHSTNPNCL